MNKIKSLNLEIINICNLKCSICDIWKNNDSDILNEKNIKNILGSKYIDKNTDITITGGEPLLYKDITNIFNTINNFGFKVNTISTNGLLYNNLEKLLIFCIKNNIQIPNIHISIDGLEKTHDIQRGIEGSFKKSIETIIKLKQNFKKINIKIKYTITKNNINDIIKIYNLSKNIGVNIAYKIVEYDDFYTNLINKPDLLNIKGKQKIIYILNKIYNNDKYINNLIYYLKTGKLKFKCTTPLNNIFVMSSGKVYVCTKYKTIGNINKNKIDNILGNNIHRDIIKEVEEKNCNKCFSLHGSFNTIKNTCK